MATSLQCLDLKVMHDMPHLLNEVGESPNAVENTIAVWSQEEQGAEPRGDVSEGGVQEQDW